MHTKAFGVGTTLSVFASVNWSKLYRLTHRYANFVACTVNSWAGICLIFCMWYEWSCYLTRHAHLSDEVSTWSRSLHAAAARGCKTRAASISQHLHLEWFVYQLAFYIILYGSSMSVITTVSLFQSLSDAGCICPHWRGGHNVLKAVDP